MFEQVPLQILASVVVVLGFGVWVYNQILGITEKREAKQLRRQGPDSMSVSETFKLELPKGIYVTHQELGPMLEAIMTRCDRRAEAHEKRCEERATKQGSDLVDVKLAVAALPGVVAKAVSTGLESVNARLDQIIDRHSGHGRSHAT